MVMMVLWQALLSCEPLAGLWSVSLRHGPPDCGPWTYLVEEKYYHPKVSSRQAGREQHHYPLARLLMLLHGPTGWLAGWLNDLVSACRVVAAVGVRGGQAVTYVWKKRRDTRNEAMARIFLNKINTRLQRQMLQVRRPAGLTLVITPHPKV